MTHKIQIFLVHIKRFKFEISSQHFLWDLSESIIFFFVLSTCRSKHVFFRLLIERKAQKVTRFGASPAVKSFWRFTGKWVCQNHKVYYTYVVLCALGLYSFWWNACVGYYRQRNAHRSIEHAILREQEWDKIKPKEEEYDEEEYGDEAPATEAAEAGEAAADAEEEEDE